MYISKVVITNIKSIQSFEMNFEAGHEAGWHVMIGDNGAGKTTILRCIALGLIGSEQAAGLRANWTNWLRKDETTATIELDIVYDIWHEDHPNIGHLNTPEELNAHNMYIANPIDKRGSFTNTIKIKYHKEDKTTKLENNQTDKIKVEYPYNIKLPGWLSVGFGPYRRFTGGAEEWNEVFKNTQLSKLAAHLTLLDESVVLTETTGWLVNLRMRQLEGKSDFFESIKELVNTPDFLPNGTKLHEVSSDGVFFTDIDGLLISINQLSDGYRSILSLTFELMRQIAQRYHEEQLFTKKEDGQIYFNYQGVVLIDEVDAHLHPTWQTRIGQWFTKYFPLIQFIVTTHSPLICRASERGTIWRLAAPGSNKPTEELTGIDKQRLVYGDILDAYGTQAFGERVTQSASGIEMAEEMAALAYKSFEGTINTKEKKRLNQLKSIMPTATL